WHRRLRGLLRLGAVPAIRVERLLREPPRGGRAGHACPGNRRRAIRGGSPAELVPDGGGVRGGVSLLDHLSPLPQSLLSGTGARNHRVPAAPGGAGHDQPPPEGRAGLVRILSYRARTRPSARIRLCRFVRSMPSARAALETFHSASSSARRMCSRSAVSRASWTVDRGPASRGMRTSSGT